MKHRITKFSCLLLALLMVCALLPATALAAPQTIRERINVRIWTGRSSVTGSWTYDNPPASYGPVKSLTTGSEASGGITVTDFPGVIQTAPWPPLLRQQRLRAAAVLNGASISRHLMSCTPTLALIRDINGLLP